MLKRNSILITLTVFCLHFYSCQNPQLNVSDSSYTMFDIDSTISKNTEFQNYIKPYQLQLDSQMNKVIGRSSETLIAKKPESSLSNFVVDILQDVAIEYISETNKESLPLISLFNTKGIRAGIPKGDVLLRDIYGVMPFENEIVLLKLTGEDIIALVNHIVNSNGDGISGFSFTIKDGTAQNIIINNKALNAKGNYYLATSDYVANGGDNYSMLQNPISRDNVGEKVRDAIISHIKSLTKQGIIIDANDKTRITLL